MKLKFYIVLILFSQVYCAQVEWWNNDTCDNLEVRFYDFHSLFSKGYDTNFGNTLMYSLDVQNFGAQYSQDGVIVNSVQLLRNIAIELNNFSFDGLRKIGVVIDSSKLAPFLKTLYLEHLRSIWQNKLLDYYHQELEKAKKRIAELEALLTVQKPVAEKRQFRSLNPEPQS